MQNEDCGVYGKTPVWIKNWNLTEMELEDLENGFPRHNVLRKQWNSIGK